MATETLSRPNLNKPSTKSGKQKASATSESSSTPTLSGINNMSADGQDGEPKVNGTEATHDSPYIKELQKNIRNVSKKLSAMQKIDAVMADNPNMDLNELVAARKINQDQKAQALKKPSLQASLTQFEEQINQYKQFEQEFQSRAGLEKDQMQASHREEVEALRKSVAAEAAAGAGKDTRQRLMTLSMFLRAAAARRQLEDDSSDESKAFEGVLLLLYGGDESAVDAAEKLIDGASEGVTSTEGAQLDVTYGRIKQMSLEYAPFAAETSWAQDVAEAEQPQGEEPESSVPVPDVSVPEPSNTEQPLPEQPKEADVAEDATAAIGTDSTIAYASMAEASAREMAVQAEPHQQTAEVIEASSVDSGAANLAAENQWDQGAAAADSMGESWVSVPRDPLETESPHTKAPQNVTQNWADDPPEPSLESTAVTPADDGFHEVHHSRGGRAARGGSPFDTRGGHRGRGGFRGGEGGGRGRGGLRGDRGGEGRGRGRAGRGSRGREGPQS